MKLEHPLEKGTLVRISRQKGLWKVMEPIHDTTGEILRGYVFLDPKGSIRNIRVGEIKSK